MGKTGHQLTGLAAGLLTAAACWHLWGSAALVAIPTGIIGGTAPDWLEVAHAEYSQARQQWVRVSVIPHRTVTHWWPLWVLALAAATTLSFPTTTTYHLFSLRLDPDQFLMPTCMGFVAGGLMHLLMDLPNPTGIPIVTPFSRSRKSLHLWRSGNHWEPVAGLAMAGLAGFVLWLAVR
ncbi:metal-dependent hydrolase [Acidithiobacillus sp. MC6.1]|nr:metal-dependent hydrolase [Acidithiobacillus sp. MC6.1]